MPSQAIERLSRAAIDTIQDPVIQKKLIDMGLEPTGFGPERLGTIMKEDFDRWGPPIRASGFQPD
jgi:tripartite-type tricarboxylate transporter receptor subunit TctC